MKYLRCISWVCSMTSSESLPVIHAHHRRIGQIVRPNIVPKGQPGGGSASRVAGDSVALLSLSEVDIDQKSRLRRDREINGI
jgi:hypothetical protein